MAKYPRVFIPDKLEEIRSSKPKPKRLRCFPKEPKKSQLQDPPVFEPPVKPKLEELSYRPPLKIITFCLIIIFLILSFVEDELLELVPIIIILTIVVFLGIRWLIQIPEENKNNLKKYNLEINDFNKKVAEAKRIFNSRIVEYEKKRQINEEEYARSKIIFHNEEKPKFLNDLNLYENYLEDLKIPERIHSYRLLHTKEFLKMVTRPVLIDNEKLKDIERGILEVFFFEILEEEFGPHVRLDLGLEKDGVIIFPDILVYNQSEGLYIAIEIDEPYIGATGEIIHYDGNEFDKERVKYFNQNGWTVVRFAEEQINEEPFLCLEFLRNLAVDIVQNLNYHKTKNFGLHTIETWNRDQAYKMGFHRYRNTYLMPSYRHLVKDEENNPYKEVKL